MQDDKIDLLQIKIEKAKAELPAETLSAIAAVDWKAVILGMRGKAGYTFEQLGALELETELVLCGMLSAKDYPKELENRMGISKAAASELVREMNEKVFSRIKEELIKNTENKNSAKLRQMHVNEPARNAFSIADAGGEKNDTHILSSAGIQIIPSVPPAHTSPPLQVEKLELGTPNVGGHPIFTEKLSGPVQTPMVKTEHSLGDIPKASVLNPENKAKIRNTDPYREIPE